MNLIKWAMADEAWESGIIEVGSKFANQSETAPSSDFISLVNAVTASIFLVKDLNEILNFSNFSTSGKRGSTLAVKAATLASRMFTCALRAVKPLLPSCEGDGRSAVVTLALVERLLDKRGWTIWRASWKEIFRSAATLRMLLLSLYLGHSKLPVSWLGR